MGLLFITHDLGIVSQISEKVAVMKNGKIVEQGQTNEVLQNPQHTYEDSGNYTVTLTVTGNGGLNTASSTIEVEKPALVDELNTPKTYSLAQNYPNPFNPVTTISFTLPEESPVTLIMYNILGREVATLVDKRLSAGSYSFVWDASGFSSGVYFYSIKAGSFVETKKLLFMK